MKISELTGAQVTQALESGTLLLDVFPFVVRVRSDVADLARDIRVAYADFNVCPVETFADFHIEVLRESGLRRWFSPLARFFFDGQPSFIPLPITQVFAMLEWGLNWCVAAHAHQYLVIHAAVVERDGFAALLPAPPGSGKSTLCAALIQRGWRLLSDELALYDMGTGRVFGMARPVNLKNASIDLIQKFEPTVLMSARVPNTTKGTIALMRPPVDSVRRVRESARPAWVVIPKYVPDSAPALARYEKAKTLMLMAEQSFNYDIHGQRGFEAMCGLVDGVDCLELTYSRLDDAIDAFAGLRTERAA